MLACPNGHTERLQYSTIERMFWDVTDSGTAYAVLNGSVQDTSQQDGDVPMLWCGECGTLTPWPQEISVDWE